MKPWAELAAPWQACLEQAWAAYQAGSLPVGAEPCALCVGAIRMLALKDVRYAARDAAAGSLDLFDASDFMRRGRVQARHFDHRELEAVLIGDEHRRASFNFRAR